MLKLSPEIATHRAGRARLAQVAKFVISLGILAYLFWQARQQDQFAVLWSAEKNLAWLGLALLAGLVASVLAFVRWYLLTRAVAIPLSPLDAVRLGFLGHLFNFLSFGVLGGDALKAVCAARRVPQRIPEAVASIAADRVIGFIAMFGMAGAAYFAIDWSALRAEHPAALDAVQALCRVSIACAVGGIIGLASLVAFPHLRRLAIVRWVEGWPRIGSVVSRLIDVGVAYRNKLWVIAAAVGLSMVANVLYAVSIWGVAAGLSANHPTLLQHCVIAPIAMVANAVPLPGGLGGMEFALDLLYRGFSQAEIPTDHGFVVALGFRVILLVVAAIGVVVYLSDKRRIDQLAD